MNIYSIRKIDEGYLAFVANGIYLGTAFRGIKGSSLDRPQRMEMKSEITRHDGTKRTQFNSSELEKFK
ncbi:hypothetical protein PRIPAC_77949 [Pristionchus pacificus]|uniref:Uncharacterized protein n=1 Tax=Pristionchus pacificus TaxID=54126 RepID=A0A2A6BXN1_PRIPA|nr:hypothetical protein PRIPAC_77949 [Pristionchus pacificus]|eukprot:PDM70533.1 hypothetical protein PRIPAC_46779 [Pristionchus pacificus]